MKSEGNSMVTLELVSLTKEKVVYKYFPEDENDFGIIQLNRVTKEPTLLKDDSRGNSVYRHHAFSKIRKYDAEGNFPKTGISAWY